MDGFDGEWVAVPPARHGTQAVWESRCQTMRGRPGEWAKFGPYSHMGTSKQIGNIRNGRYGDGFDAFRRSEDGQDWIYATFVADHADDPQPPHPGPCPDTCNGQHP